MMPIASKIFAELDSEDLQKDLNSLYNRSLDNNLHFGMPKCVLLSSNQKTSNTCTWHLVSLQMPVYLPILIL